MGRRGQVSQGPPLQIVRVLGEIVQDPLEHNMVALDGLRCRPYAGRDDLDRTTDLLLSSRARSGFDRYPTGRRLHLLATSRLWEPQRDARVWMLGDASPAATDTNSPVLRERMVGLSLLWRRQWRDPYVALEMVINLDQAAWPSSLANCDHADAAELTVAAAMLAWAARRAREIAGERGQPIQLSAGAFDEQVPLRALLEAEGFRLRDEHNVYMACHLREPRPKIEPPEGFVIRSLASEGEIDAYHALYRFAPMDPQHRLELLHSPEYAHLVATAPDGSLAAFCECSIERAEWARGGRRTAWAEYVGTRPDLEGRGLGRAVIAAGLDWMERQGAETAALITMERNFAAQRAYAAAGFQIVERDLLYTCEIIPGQPATQRRVTQRNNTDPHITVQGSEPPLRS